MGNAPQSASITLGLFNEMDVIIRACPPSLTTLSNCYSFCCLVWEVCTEKEPWPGMIAKSTSKMWFNDQGPGPLNSQLPLYLVSFLELGLRPDIGLRKDFNLKRILWALRTKQELNFNGHSSQPSPESKITKAA